MKAMNTAFLPHLRKRFLPIILPLFLGLFGFLSSKCIMAEEWIDLGKARSGMSTERKVFHLEGSRQFSKLRFHTENGDILLKKTKIHFGNQQAVIEGLQKLIKVGGYSRAIPLAHKQRSIQKVEVFYSVVKQTSPIIDPQITLMGVEAL